MSYDARCECVQCDPVGRYGTHYSFGLTAYNEIDK